MASPKFHGVAAGEQLGNLEYLIDDSVVLEYEGLVGELSVYANLIADDCVAMAAARFGDSDLSVVWRRFDFLRPPVPGRRIQSGGWLKEIRGNEENPWLRISAFAVDEIGTEILRSEAALTTSHSKAENAGPVPNDFLQSADSAEHGFEGRVGETLSLGRWVVPTKETFAAYRKLRTELAGRVHQGEHNGTTELLAGWLEGRIGRIFGDDFRWGGRLSLAYHAAIAPGHALTADAVVIEQERDHSGVSTVRLYVGAWGQCNERIASGFASVSIPSPRLY
jgi:hypothetical protein